MIERFFSQFASSFLRTKIAMRTVAGIWTMVLVALVAGCTVSIEQPSQALESTLGAGPARIVLEPAVGPVGTLVTVQGDGWNPGGTILLYLVAPGETDLPSYASAGAMADAEGRFITGFMVPSEPGWEPAGGPGSQGMATVIARATEGGASAQAFFIVVSSELPLTPTVLAATEPMTTPTSPAQTPEPPDSTPQEGQPTLTSTTDLNVRSGPGVDYPVLGLLKAGQSAEVTGVSADRGWWQIRFPGAVDGQGWVSARYVSTENAEGIQVVPAIALPPTPTPVAISEWRGEYYNNRNLSGPPVLVRNDAAINFDWGTGAPTPGMQTDNFSVRWTRGMSFTAGTYRFYANVDDGVRLWVDGTLVIDRWHDTSPTTYTADVYLAEGTRSLRMEYYEHTGGAVAQLAWERLEDYPDWRGEYFDNPNLSGAPVLVRNDATIDFYWPESPGPGVPADNFAVRWTRTQYFPAYVYRFDLVVDDGARLWVDDQLIIDAWRTGPPRGYSAEIGLSEGFHTVRLEYFEFRYGAQVYLNVMAVQNGSDWKAEYFDNRRLAGKPVLKRNDGLIKFNWGTGSPGPGVPADNFSARWQRDVDFEEGTYIFSVWVDDGVRLWVDDTLLIDSWQEGRYRLRQAEHWLSGGTHRVKVEYFERTGHAQIEVSWERKS